MWAVVIRTDRRLSWQLQVDGPTRPFYQLMHAAGCRSRVQRSYLSAQELRGRGRPSTLPGPRAFPTALSRPTCGVCAPVSCGAEGVGRGEAPRATSMRGRRLTQALPTMPARRTRQLSARLRCRRRRRTRLASTTDELRRHGGLRRGALVRAAHGVSTSDDNPFHGRPAQAHLVSYARRVSTEPLGAMGLVSILPVFSREPIANC